MWIGLLKMNEEYHRHEIALVSELDNQKMNEEQYRHEIALGVNWMVKK